MKKLINWITQEDKVYKRSDKIIVTLGLSVAAVLCVGLVLASEWYVTLWLLIVALFIGLLIGVFSLIDKYVIKDINLTKTEMRQIARKNLKSAHFIHKEYGNTEQASAIIQHNLKTAHNRDFQIVFRMVNLFIKVFLTAYVIHFILERSYISTQKGLCENIFCRLGELAMIIPPNDNLSYSLAFIYGTLLYFFYICLKKIIKSIFS